MDEGQLHTLASLLPGKEPGTHYVGGCMGPRAGVNAVEKIKIHVPAVNRIPAVLPIAFHYADWARLQIAE
jgi:hypothetical protein